MGLWKNDPIYTSGHRFTVIQGTLGIHQVLIARSYDGMIFDSWTSKTRFMSTCNGRLLNSLH